MWTDDAPRKKGHRGVKVAGVVVAVLLVLAGIGALSGGGDKGSTTASTSTPTSDNSSDAATPYVQNGTAAADSTEAATPTPAAPTMPKYTVAQEQAIQSAQGYLDMGGTSRAGLIDQLSSKYGEGFRKADAKFAVNHIKVDWNKQAVESAKGYLDMGGFSRASLIQQLSSNSGEKFTLAQAKYAVKRVGL